MKKKPAYAPATASAEKSPRILIVYPHNFTLRNSGINSRYYELLRYFTARNFHLDVLGLKGFMDQWPDDENVSNDEIKVEGLYLYDFQEGIRQTAASGWNVRKLFSRIFSKSSSLKYQELPDFAFSGMRKYFDRIVSSGHYNYILISYAYWAGLIEGRSYPDTTLVLEISDFLTLNLYDAENGAVDIGALMNEELRRVNLFNKVFCINEEELRFFSRLAKKPEFFYIPHFMKLPEIHREEPGYDICLVASDNPHNIKGIEWFYREVMPLLPEKLHYLIVGKITGHLPRLLENVRVIPFAEDLRKIYGSSKIAICPLLGGTGMKIKVVEALSYGLPVVSTSFGVTGFPDKSNNGCLVADEPQTFAAYLSKLVSDGPFYNSQHQLALNYFMRHFEQDAGYRNLDKIFYSST